MRVKPLAIGGATSGAGIRAEAAGGVRVAGTAGRPTSRSLDEVITLVTGRELEQVTVLDDLAYHSDPGVVLPVLAPLVETPVTAAGRG